MGNIKGLTTVVSYPERGVGGNNKYRGNCSPKLIEDLINFYKPSEICDYMVGSGTTFDAAKNCGIVCHGYDLNRGFDLMNNDIPERSELTFWHPPYADIITYSDVMYSAEDIRKKYGFDPRESDLSRIKDWDKFVEAMNYCCMKQFAALEKGGRMAVLMGDIKKKGKLYSMLADIAKPGTLEQIVIKTQHNCVSDRTTYSGKFIPIVHEYLMIVRKDNSIYIPVMLTTRKTVDIRDMECSTWRDVVAAVLEQHKGSVSLNCIYEQIENHKKAKANQWWKEKVRQTLQRNPQYFNHDGRGMWSLNRAAA